MEKKNKKKQLTRGKTLAGNQSSSCGSKHVSLGTGRATRLGSAAGTGSPPRGEVLSALRAKGGRKDARRFLLEHG